MKELVIVKPNTLSQKDRENLLSNNYLVIEHPDPSEVIITDTANNTTLLVSALKGAMSNSYSKIDFAEELNRQIYLEISKHKK